uniref:Uncharacterized protein n=1 Tax=Peronospora matthiolae TaxID=2874970 RepID=A0AAV1VC96_9STRA
MAAANEDGPELMIHKNNQSCIKMTKNPVNHGRAKHIDINCHHIRDEVKRGEVKLEYCETSVMMADIITKGTCGTSSQELDDSSRHLCVFELRGRIEGYRNNPNCVVLMGSFLRR